MPRISVIVPAYNVEKFLAETLDSVLAQTFRDFEIIIVDDGSSDGTPAVAQGYSTRYPGTVRYLRQENRGVAVARNEGAKLSQGDILAFLDADDTWLPEKLALQMEFWRKHPGYGLIYADAFAMTEDGKVGRTTMRLKRPRSGDIFPYLLEENFISIPTALVRKDLYLKAGGFIEERNMIEDHHFWLKVSRHCQGGFLDKPLACYRYRQGSLSGLINPKIEMWEKDLQVIARIAAEFPEQARLYRARFRRARASIRYGMAFQLYRTNRFAEARKAYVRALIDSPLYVPAWKGLAICALLPERVLTKRNAGIPQDENDLLSAAGGLLRKSAPGTGEAL
jgi:glycosyltransferase involved in cell wall biosynthesis